MKQDFKDYIKQTKTCFVTNDPLQPKSIVYRSLSTYIDIADDNLYIIPGKVNGINTYGIRAFVLYMLPTMLENGYDYVIYVDNDCFVYDTDMLYKMFNEFVDGNYCIGGVADGGMICHRNHNNMMINTFLSFWNIKAVREYLVKNNINYSEYLKSEDSPLHLDFETFTDRVSQEMFDRIDNSTKFMSDICSNLRGGLESTYCSVVRNDPNNPIEPHQEPYTYKHDDFEPYYCLIEWMVLVTDLPIMFFESYDSDLIGVLCEDINDIDPTGITSIVCYQNKPVACHTWFGRCWNVEKTHTERIFSVFQKTFSKTRSIL